MLLGSIGSMVKRSAINLANRTIPSEIKLILYFFIKLIVKSHYKIIFKIHLFILLNDFTFSIFDFFNCVQ
jgi:hypothetical protein